MAQPHSVGAGAEPGGCVVDAHQPAYRLAHCPDYVLTSSRPRREDGNWPPELVVRPRADPPFPCLRFSLFSHGPLTLHWSGRWCHVVTTGKVLPVIHETLPSSLRRRQRDHRENRERIKKAKILKRCWKLDIRSTVHRSGVLSHRWHS